ncbi:hypothetical protein CRUP_024506 [Coryphaenoides rupestris]|nr:hypothetical protein CRUP_024506 [Coryphaenoides rupestris]
MAMAAVVVPGLTEEEEEEIGAKRLEEPEEPPRVGPRTRIGYTHPTQPRIILIGMATLGPESLRHSYSHSQLGGSSSGQLGGMLAGGMIASHNPPPCQPPNRASERALEEAAGGGGGVLNLSARKLKEFPRSAANHDLTDTVEADLSKNRLTDVPSEICQLLSVLPACLSRLPLRVLNASNNKLVSLPDTIAQLHHLMELVGLDRYQDHRNTAAHECMQCIACGN